MTSEEFQRLEDLIVKANQSGKRETSGLVAEIMHRMESGIEASIDKNVNGKIRKLDEKIDAYIKSDNEWKEEFEPYMKGIVNLSGTGKIMLKLVMAVSAGIGLYLLIRENFFK